jgi:hypothetical protein
MSLVILLSQKKYSVVEKEGFPFIFMTKNVPFADMRRLFSLGTLTAIIYQQFHLTQNFFIKGIQFESIPI